jgi:hypothetical protein
MDFAAFHLGDHNIAGGVREHAQEGAYAALVADLSEPFSRADFPEVIRRVDRHFGGSTYNLRSLFRDEQRRVLEIILGTTLADVEASYRAIFERHGALMRFVADLGVPVPEPLTAAAGLALNGLLREALESDEPDPERVRALLEDAEKADVELAAASLGYTLSRTVERLAARLAESPFDPDRLDHLDAAVRLARSLPFEVDFWKAQNIYHDLLLEAYPEALRRAPADEAARSFAERFAALGEPLSVLVSGEGQ